jgi:hypothetical protein
MSWKVVENAGGHGRNPNGIVGLLCREHFPRLVEYAGVTGPAYTFDHYADTPRCSRSGQQGIRQQGGAGEARAVGKSSYIVKYVAFVVHS